MKRAVLAFGVLVALALSGCGCIWAGGLAPGAPGP